MERDFSKLQAALTFSWDFLVALEQTLTLATLWLYIVQYWDQGDALLYYGLTFLLYGICRFSGYMLCGCLIRRRVSTKYMIVTIESVAVIGNVLYFLAWHPTVVLFGKGITGFVDCDIPVFSTINKSQDKLELTRFSMFSSLSRITGWSFGALLLIPMSLWKFNSSSQWLNLSVYNFIGLLMAILWLIHVACIIFLHKIQETPAPTETQSSDGEEDSKSMLSNVLHSCDNFTSIILLWTVFMLKFILFSFQTMLAPVLYSLFLWKEDEIAYFYILSIFLTVSTLMFTLLISKLLSEAVITVLGLVLMFLAHIGWSIYFGVDDDSLSQTEVMIILIFCFLFHSVGLPAATICLESLYKQTLPIAQMDSGFESYHAFVNFGYLLGPAFGAFLWESKWIIFIVYTLLSAGTIMGFLCNRQKLLTNESH